MQHIHIKSCDFAQHSQLRCQKSLFEVQRGTASPESVVQADQDIVIQGFDHFTQQGQFRAKRFVTIDGNRLDRQPESYTFAGAVYLAKLLSSQDQGKTVAWQYQLTAPNILFDKTHQFSGHYLFVQAQSDKPLTPIVLKTATGSQITLGFGGHLHSQNRFLHHGDIAISAPLSYGFPTWEYWLGGTPRDRSHTTPEFRQALHQLSQDMSHPRHLLNQKVKDTIGIFLEATGTLEYEGSLEVVSQIFMI